ncbi:unnamed protein product [Heterosigma akashiwo]|mmetsp:Transcript_3973/g.5527  ORF Transcript_3973/g.5527 Transcript_3973/m.5527 type:complete len:104 (-) Transcript_3973:372-683(-)|eukprot:CAMPEP_0194563980 /NCGR_PEP_ID=MMETSP0292-20121207/3819_1 /TAXON_ID=39354 /ORGANISM="Heterosigma akashiwo, Strain CCMP2393" /LENGTH=103 /DNA_ID=CAMNT_0039413019 /DNA_START=107 /DNA_END=418 /DNA_ORIENTATION=-
MDVPELSDQELRKVMSHPLVKTVDMPGEMCNEALEVVTMAVDKFASTKNYEAAATSIKNTMDKKCGATWHCAIGEGFGFDVTYQQKNMIYVFYGQVGVLIFKC